MPEMPLISIIIPVYNVERYLRRCLDSVLAQTFADWECVVVDDGSLDGCPAICDEYAARDRRFRALHQDNGGLSAARNAGIRAARGGYIALLDSDDMLADDDALRGISSVIERTGVPVVFNTNLTVLNGNEVSSINDFRGDADSYSAIEFYKEIQKCKKTFLAGCLAVLKRDFLLKNDLFFKTGILHEDEHWMPRVICAAERIGVNYAPFYLYRQAREGSITSTLTPKRLYDMIKIIDDLLSMNKKAKNLPRAYKAIYTDRCVSLYCRVFGQIFLLDERYFEDREIIKNKLRQYLYILLYSRKLKYYIYYPFLQMLLGPLNNKLFQAIVMKVIKIRYGNKPKV